MNFEVYSDESGLEALSKKDAHRFIAIGGVWMPSEFRDQFKLDFKTIKDKYNVQGELKWKKVSPAYYLLYENLVQYFYSTPELRFRVIVIESMKVDNHRFHNDDVELGFYKWYYQLLHHWIFDFNTYKIFLDHKINRDKGRVNDLFKVLDNANLTSEIKQVQALPSEQSQGIQLADILTGITAAKFNQKTTSEAKNKIIHFTESLLNREIAPTGKWEEKFNVFKINLQGGW